jgi:hypothetical protein
VGRVAHVLPCGDSAFLLISSPVLASLSPLPDRSLQLLHRHTTSSRDGRTKTAQAPEKSRWQWLVSDLSSHPISIGLGSELPDSFLTITIAAAEP